MCRCPVPATAMPAGTQRAEASQPHAPLPAKAALACTVSGLGSGAPCSAAPATRLPASKERQMAISTNQERQ